jgi:arginine:ornithine antiporter / lysine permease
MTSAPQSQQLSLRSLIALVVGSMIGSGIFALPAAFGRATGALGALMAWAIAGENHHGVPVAALWSTNIVIQSFVLVTYFAEYAFGLALKLTSAMTLIAYLLVAAYGLKLAWTRETYDTEPRERNRDVVIGSLAAAYALAMIVAGGLKFVLLAALLYAPGTVLFRMARRHKGYRCLRRRWNGLCSALPQWRHPLRCTVS